MRWGILFTALVYSGASVSAYLCPGPDWFYRKGSETCYYVSKAKVSDGWTNEVADHMNWAEVKNACEVIGGAIVTIDNAEELEWIKAKIPSDMFYWIGMTFENLKWQWYDGKTYRDYTPIPGLTVPTLSAVDTNRMRRGSLKYNFNSRKIDFFLETNYDTNRNGFICKGTYSGKPWCPEGWFFHDGRCHLFNPLGSWFDSAQSTCQYYGGYLMTVNSQVEDERIKTWLRERANSDKGWLGISIANKSASTTAADVKWLDSTPIKDTPIKNWVNSDIDAYITNLPNDKKYCGEITTREGWDDLFWQYFDDHDWRLVPECISTLPFICEAPLNKCPYGWTHLDDYCYQFNHGELLTWQGAREMCQGQGGDLINIKTEKVQTFVFNHLINQYDFVDYDLQHFWIGLKSSGGRYAWTDGSAVDFNYWSGGLQPTNTNDPCVYIDGNYVFGPGRHGDWNASVCTQPFGYICQAHNTATIPPDVIVKPEHSCSGPFEKYHEKCYLFVSEQKNRDDAQRYCRDQGSTLVMIHSFGENTWIAGKATGDIWIGLKRTGKPLAYDEFTYSNDFIMGEGGYKNFGYQDTNLNDFSSNQFDKFCINMAGVANANADPGKWFHSKCTEQRAFVCSHEGTPYIKPYPDNDHSDALCGGGWFRNGENCYRIQHYDYESWHAAKQICHNYEAGSELLYITSKEENQFIRDVLIANYSIGGEWSEIFGFDFTSEYWIDLYAETPGGWFWPYVDSTDKWKIPFAISHWADNQPSQMEFGRNNPHCAVIDDHYQNPRWYSYACGIKRNFICKKVLPSATVAPVTPAPTAQPGFHLGCAHGWFNENGRCVRFNITGASWEQAREICVANKASLASIQNNQELADFLRFGTGAWIGLNAINDPKAPRVFTWSNGESVAYTPWDIESASPNITGSHHNDANCGALTNAGMAVYPCSEKRTFICERSLENLQGDGSVTIEIPHVPGCRQWGIPFHGNCYYFGEDPGSPYGERKFQNFDAAVSFCQSQYGGALVTIKNDDEQEFITGIVARHGSDFWIGLKEEANPWSAFKKWIDGTSVSVTNWAYGEPPLTEDGRTGCVAMYGLYGENKIPGRWYVNPCTERKYALCKSVNTLSPTHQTLPPRPTPNPNGCPTAWKTNPDMPSCYKGYVSPYNGNAGVKVNWYAAEEFCRRFRGGHLVSIDTEAENRFIEFTVLSGFSSAHLYWIGMKENEWNGYRWEWSDGSPITGQYWHQTQQHHDADIIDCASMDWINGKWVQQSCQQANGYICEIPKDAYYENELVNEYPTASPLNTTCGISTLDGEWFYDHTNTECVYFSKKPESWENAQQACELMHSNLVTVTNRSHDFITLKSSQAASGSTVSSGVQYWIGLHMIDMVTREWAWVDGHVSYFRAWSAGRPRNGTERCVAHNSRSGRWEDHNCNRATNRYICAKTGRTRPTRPPRPPGGNCAEGWVAHGEYCYRISAPTQNMTWQEATDDCLNGMRGSLVSIHSPVENDFLITLMKDRHENDYWTGLHAISGDYDTWYWSDETPLMYTNWRHGEYIYTSSDYCIAMGSRRGQAGKWYKIRCSERRGSICKALKDSNLPVPSIPQSFCPSEYSQFGTTACYAVRKLDDGRNTWQDAQQACKSIGDGHGDLATAEDIFDNAKFRTMLFETMNNGRNHTHHNFTAWIGMKEHLGSFSWYNGCPVVFSNLDSINIKPRGDACVLMDHHGRWSPQECNAQASYAVCERRTAPCKPAFNLTDNGYCPNDFPHECSNRCFRVEVVRSHNNRTEHVPRAQAKERCEAMNDGHGRLASIRTEEEQRCLEKYLDHAVGPMWIGLYEAQRENGDYYWKWEDEGHTYQATSFINWEAGYPVFSDSIYWRDGCVEMKPDGKWINSECNSYDDRGYICESRKIHGSTVERTTRNTPPPTIGPSVGPIGEQESDGMSGGTIAGIVIGVLLAVAVVGAIGYVVVTGKSGAVVSSVRGAASSASSRFKGFGNNNYDQHNDKEPVANDFNGPSDSYS